MIFVRLAIGSASSGLRRQSTSPRVHVEDEPGARRLAQVHVERVDAAERHVGHRLRLDQRRGLARLRRRERHRRRADRRAAGWSRRHRRPSSNESHAAAATATGAARIATIASRRGSASAAGRPGGPVEGKGWRRAPSHPAAAEVSAPSTPKPSSARMITREHHQDVDPPLDRDRDRQERQQADDRQAADEGERSAHQYTGIRCCRLVVLVHVVREQLDREQPEQEAADVGEVRHPAPGAPDRLAERGKQLQQEPQPQHEQRGQVTTVKKMMMKITVTTRARGYSRA